MGSMCSDDSSNNNSDYNTMKREAGSYESKNDENSQNTVISSGMQVGIFFDTFVHYQWQTAVVQQRYNNEDDGQTLKKVTIQWLSLVAKVCKADGNLSASEAAYITKNGAAAGLTKAEIGVALKGEATIEEFPFDSDNPYSRYESFGNKKMSRKRVIAILLMQCIVAAAQDGLQTEEHNQLYAYADKLKVNRGSVDKYVKSLAKEQDLFMTWRDML